MNYKGKQTRFTLALRSDMDALPMTEENPGLFQSLFLIAFFLLNFQFYFA